MVFVVTENYSAAASRPEGRSHSRGFVYKVTVKFCLHPLTHTICNHISPVCLCALCLRKQPYRNIVTYPCCVERLHLAFYLVHFDPFCLSLAWDEGSPSAVCSLELMLRLASKGEGRALILPCSAAGSVISTGAKWTQTATQAER